MITRIALAVSMALCLLSGTGHVQAKESGATEQVRQVLDKAMQIQTREDLAGDAHRKERAKLVHALIDSSFLSADMAREALSESWGSLSESQRTEFTGLFTRLFQSSYTRLVLSFLQRESVEYRGETNKDGITRVNTVIMRANEHIPVDYKMTQKSGRWYISDVVIDGVSIVENYRNSFGKVIRTGSFSSLLDKMRLQSKAIHEDAP